MRVQQEGGTTTSPGWSAGAETITGRRSITGRRDTGSCVRASTGIDAVRVALGSTLGAFIALAVVVAFVLLAKCTARRRQLRLRRPRARRRRGVRRRRRGSDKSQPLTEEDSVSFFDYFDDDDDDDDQYGTVHHAAARRQDHCAVIHYYLAEHTVRDDRGIVRQNHPTVHRDHGTEHDSHGTVYQNHGTVHNDHGTVHCDHGTEHDSHGTVHHDHPASDELSRGCRPPPRLIFTHHEFVVPEACREWDVDEDTDHRLNHVRASTPDTSDQCAQTTAGIFGESTF